MACSSDSHSTMMKPSSCSLVSAKGPSSTTGSRLLRMVVAAVVGMSWTTGPSRRAAFSLSSTAPRRSDELTYELQSLMRNSYAVLCMTKKPTPSTTSTTLPPFRSIHTQHHYTLHLTYIHASYV